jgi:hypothetical protein
MNAGCTHLTCARAGERTFGKGLSQRVVQLKGDWTLLVSSLKVGWARVGFHVEFFPLRELALPCRGGAPTLS